MKPNSVIPAKAGISSGAAKIPAKYKSLAGMTALLLLLTSCFAYSETYNLATVDKAHGIYQVTSTENLAAVENFVQASKICPRAFKLTANGGGAFENKQWVYGDDRPSYTTYLITCTE